jgi:hypothetical protein
MARFHRSITEWQESRLRLCVVAEIMCALSSEEVRVMRTVCSITPGLTRATVRGS